MDTELINLAWNEFQSSAIKAFQTLEGDSNFADVTLACKGGQQLKAHKVILSSCSPFFKDILVQNPHKHPLIYLNGIDMSDLKSLVKFIYSGEVNVSNDSLSQFLDAANILEIQGLKQKPEQPKDADVPTPQNETEGMFDVQNIEEEIQMLAEVASAKPLDERMNVDNITEEEEEADEDTGVDVQEELDQLDEEMSPIMEETLETEEIEPEEDMHEGVSDLAPVWSPMQRDEDLVVDLDALLEQSRDLDALQEVLNNPKTAEEDKKPSDPNPYSCDFCPRSFNRRYSVYRHMRKVHKAEQSSDQTLKAEQVSEQPLEEKSYYEQVSKQPLVEKSYEEQVSEQPLVEKHFEEPLPATTSENILDPESEPWNNVDTSSNCNVCFKTFTTNYSMVEHKKSVHEGIRFPCDHCDHIASSKRNLRGHMAKRHPAEELPVTYNTVILNDEEKEKERVKNSHKSHNFKIKKEPMTEIAAEPEQDERKEIIANKEVANEVPKEDEPVEEESVRLLCPHCAHTAESKDSLIQHMGDNHIGRPRPTSFMSIKGSTRPKPPPKARSNHIASGQILMSMYPDIVIKEKPAARDPGLDVQYSETAETEQKLDSVTEQQDDGTWRCLECGKNFKSKFSSRRHAETHFKSKEGFPCEMCDNVSTSAASLKFHVYRKHAGV